MAELKLKVSLDTSYLRGQISRLPLEFAGANVSIRPKFDRKTIVNEFALLNRYISSKKFNIVINTNLEAEIKNADRLVQALGRVQQAASGAKGGLPIGTQVLSRTKTKGGFAAAEIKALFGAAVQGGLIDDKTLASTRAQMVTALGNIGRDSIAGLLNGLKSGDADIQKAAQMLGNNLITSFKTVLGIASPSKEFRKLGEAAGQGFEQGLLRSIEIAEQSATRKMQRMLDRLARMALMMSGMSGPEIGRQIAQARALPALNFGATTPRTSVGVGPSSTGRALPPGKPPVGMISGAQPPVGLLSASTSLSRSAIDALIAKIGPQILASGGGDGTLGKLALSPKQLKANVDAILRDYFKVVEIQVKEAFDAPRAIKSQLNTFSFLVQAIKDAEDRTKSARIDQSVESLMQSIDNAIKVAQAKVRNVARIYGTGAQLPDSGQRALPPAYRGIQPSAAPIGFLSPGRGMSATDARIQQAYARSAARSASILGEPQRLLPTDAESARRRPAQYRTQEGSTGASSQLGAGYFAVGKGLQSIKQAHAGVKSFLETKSLPISGAIADLGAEFGNAIKQVLLFGTAYKALAFLTSLPREALEAAKGLATYRNQLQAVTAESGTFEQSFAFVDGLARQFNVPLESARQGFVKLYASMQPAGFDQGQIENLFTGISKAAAAFGLSADKVDRVNYAFAQMASKGQIMSEELKGQLGDVLPGALGLFAKAAQMSIPEFSKAMEDGAFKGKAMEQVLGNVAILLNNKFGAAAKGAAKTLQGAVTQIQNNLALMYQSFAPIVDGVAAAFGPQVNALIKDVTDTVKALTTALAGGGSSFDSLSPRAQGFYNAIKTLEPALRQAGAALVDMGNRLAQLAPLFIEVLATAISFAASPLARAALIASVAIGALTAALKVLEVTGLKAALKTIYSFISSLAVGIPQATGVARVALISLKLAVTGLFVGAILLGLDFLVGKILDVGGAAQKSIKDVKQLAIDLDRLTGAQDMVGLGVKRQEAENAVIIAERLLQTYQKLDKGIKLSGQEQDFLRQYGTKNPLQSGTAFAQARLTSAMEQRGMTQKSLETAQRLADEEKVRREEADSKLAKIDLSSESDKQKQKATNLESYYSLQDQLAKAQTQADIDRIEAAFEYRKQLINNVYDLEEIRANSIQKEAIAHQRAISNIFLDLQKKQIDARLSMMKAEGSVAGGAAPMGAATSGKTGLFQGSTGVSSGPHFDVRRQDGAYISPEQARALFDPSVRGRLAMTSAYGPRRAPVPGASTFHKGVDLAGPANTPLNLAAGYTMTGAGEKGGLGYAASIRGPQGEMYDVGHLQRPAMGTGAPRKVPGSEKRDLLAEQAKINAGKQAAISLTNAEAEAQQRLVIETEKYLAQMFGVAEKELQTSMLQKKTAMLRAGATDQEIEDAMSLEELNLKYVAGIEAANAQITRNKALKDQGAISQDELNKRNAYQNFLIKELNKELPKATKAQTDFNKAQKEAAFTGRVAALKEEIKLLLIANDAERRLAELRKEYKDEAKVKEIFNLESVRKNIADTRELVDGFVSSTASDYKGFLKAVISGEDAADALKQFQEGLKDRVLTIFLDFAMKPVEDFLKEGFFNLFKPKGLPDAGAEKEAAKDPVEAANLNTTATNANTEEIRKLTTVLSGTAGADQSTGLSSAIKGIGLSSGINTSLSGIGGAAMAGFDAASVFGNPEALKESFAGIQSSIGASMNGIVSSFESGAASLATTLPSWSDSLATKLPAALTQSKEKVEGETPDFQESLGKVAQGIGIAATTIMGIAAGISQIKEGGTSNVLMGIGSILASVGGGIGGFTKLFAADGGVAAGGWKPLPLTAFANGGMVSGPTLGLIGEGKYNEAIVPLPNGRSIPVEMTGAGGGSLRDAMGQAPGQNTSPILNMSFQSTTINGVEYVSRDQLEQAMAQTRREASRDGAQRGMTMTLDKLQQSPTTRRRVGI